MAETVGEVKKSLDGYDSHCADLAHGGQPQMFRVFLLQAPHVLVQLGEKLGGLGHIASFCRYRFPRQRVQPVDPETIMSLFTDFALSIGLSADEPDLIAVQNWAARPSTGGVSRTWNGVGSCAAHVFGRVCNLFGVLPQTQPDELTLGTLDLGVVDQRATQQELVDQAGGMRSVAGNGKLVDELVRCHEFQHNLLDRFFSTFQTVEYIVVPALVSLTVENFSK
jgi:hypothetical protein